MSAEERPDDHADGSALNSVLTSREATGHLNYSRGLNELIEGFDLVDMWDTSQRRDIYTLYKLRSIAD
jgi:hypothetical protein